MHCKIGRAPLQSPNEAVGGASDLGYDLHRSGEKCPCSMGSGRPRFSVAGGSASAQTQQQNDWCTNKDHAFAPDLRINGCTASIQSGKWKGSAIAWAYNNRCWAYNEAGDHDRAIADCNEAIRLDPKNATAYNSRGNAYHDKGDNDRAIDDYNEALLLKPQSEGQK
jgi:tetratricopeptide (TPR) repeat protein